MLPGQHHQQKHLVGLWGAQQRAAMRYNIDLEIPDFPDQEKRTIFLFAGINCIARKPAGQPWQIKTGHCTMCGKCCSSFKKDKHVPPVVNGKCMHLQTKGRHVRCGLGIYRPFACGIAEMPIEGCTVKFIEQA